MKLSQLMLAGDYLTYKGDWVTNTAYNVNECVTWTDGHLYQVIKAHTSSSTIDPSNAEYYKAMTATKYVKHSYSNIGAQQIAEIIEIFKKVQNGKNVYAMTGFEVYTPSLVGAYTLAYLTKVSTSAGTINALIYQCLKIEGTQIIKATFSTANPQIVTETITSIDILEEV